MKKFLVVCLSLLCLMFTFGLTACGDKDNNELIDLADCEIGYELPVYPSCEFDYKVNDDCVVHISSIKAVLVQKNEIHEGDLLTENFTPYIVELRFLGRTDASNVDKNIKVRLNLQITSMHSLNGFNFIDVFTKSILQNFCVIGVPPVLYINTNVQV